MVNQFLGAFSFFLLTIVVGFTGAIFANYDKKRKKVKRRK